MSIIIISSNPNHPNTHTHTHHPLCRPSVGEITKKVYQLRNITSEEICFTSEALKILSELVRCGQTACMQTDCYVTDLPRLARQLRPLKTRGIKNTTCVLENSCFRLHRPKVLEHCFGKQHGHVLCLHYNGTWTAGRMAEAVSVNHRVAIKTSTIPKATFNANNSVLESKQKHTLSANGNVPVHYS